jgi:hypothetical protein
LGGGSVSGSVQPDSQDAVSRYYAYNNEGVRWTHPTPKELQKILTDTIWGRKEELAMDKDGAYEEIRNQLAEVFGKLDARQAEIGGDYDCKRFTDLDP